MDKNFFKISQIKGRHLKQTDKNPFIDDVR